MAPIDDTLLERYKFILMYDDERVIDAVAALDEANGADWWYLVVDLSGGGYAAAPYSALVAGIKSEGEDYLMRPLRDVVGGALEHVECVAEQQAADLDAISQQAAESRCPVAVILNEGDVQGILPVAGTRGVFDVGVINLAGKYAPLPERGLLSPRRKQTASKKKANKSSSQQDKQPPGKLH